MLRVATQARAFASRPNALRQRTLATSVLMTRTWETENISALKREAKKRGLPTKGANKAVLISRLQEHDQRTLLTSNTASTPSDAAKSPSPVPASLQVRNASTVLEPPKPVPEPATAIPGVPESADPTSPVPPAFLDIKLPDLSPPPEPPVQVPFLPDFWESSLVKGAASSSSNTDTAEPPRPPKLHVVSGSETHIQGGPSHQLHEVVDTHDLYRSPSLNATVDHGTGLKALLYDMAEDLGLPTSREEQRRLVEQLAVPESSALEEGLGKNFERKLDNEEKKGVWALIGLLVGSWVLGGVTR